MSSRLLRFHASRGVIGAVAVALALAACGGGDVGGTGAAGGTVKIGLPHPLTGVWAEGGQNALNGALLAIDDVNAAGGIKSLKGAKLSGVPADTSSDDPGQAASVTRRLVQQDGVSALIGAYVSALSLTASTEAEKAGVPMLTQAYTDELTKRGYHFLFQLPPPSSAIGAQTVPYVQDAFATANIPLQRVAVVSSNDAALKAQAEGTASVAQSKGLEVVSTEFYPIDITDASVMSQQVIGTRPDIVFLGGPTAASILVVQTLRSLGYTGPVVGLGGGGILDKGFGDALGDNVNGVLSMAAWNWDMPFDGMVDVNKRYMDRFDQPFMPQEAGESYVAVWDLAQSMEDAGSSEPKDIATALQMLSMTTGPGSFMPGQKVSFSESGLNPDTFPMLIQWQDGVPKGVWPMDVQAVPPIAASQ
ncbi:branched-chain amino acid transport system substrate-binding protein [Modestobacter sp. DSM 44400]|uniref:ABC transporter substrate-binding protein n=1 Tax=Modestobacter sp. DSM 44400 TaxID=1550230 RepID=UPI0008988962|nr:ABC transporter substrate-binding protein [Modestobacter sp. DSM 44400]SDX99726.1 branched-chain amino acid transport system substrate-binding protein [Modestobacter sp. DSM 44400]